jgi:hypothetical protein
MQQNMYTAYDKNELQRYNLEIVTIQNGNIK